MAELCGGLAYNHVLHCADAISLCGCYFIGRMLFHRADFRIKPDLGMIRPPDEIVFVGEGQRM